MKKKNAKIGAGTAAPPSCDTVFEAMAWDAANPREPAARTFMDLEYGLDQLLEVPRARASKPPRAARRGSRLHELLSRARALR